MCWPCILYPCRTRGLCLYLIALLPLVHLQIVTDSLSSYLLNYINPISSWNSSAARSLLDQEPHSLGQTHTSTCKNCRTGACIYPCILQCYICVYSTFCTIIFFGILTLFSFQPLHQRRVSRELEDAIGPVPAKKRRLSHAVLLSANVRWRYVVTLQMLLYNSYWFKRKALKTTL